LPFSRIDPAAPLFLARHAGFRATGVSILPRRAFDSGSRHLNKPEIEALGYVQLKLPGKHSE
jgi:hypothetical protein